MKRMMLCLAVLAMTFSVNGQIKTPASSPFSKVEQKVGLTDMVLEYSRPSMKGRTIFGDLVPFEKIWRTGANMNTKITFSTNVSIDGKSLDAGTYAIYTVPMKGKWEVIFYTDFENGGLPETWDDNKVALRTTAVVHDLPMSIETFSIGFDDLTNDSVVLGMLWEKTYVGIKIDVPTMKMVMINIEEVMKGEPTANDFFAAAVYYSEQNIDIDQARNWMDEGMKMTKEPRFWQLRQQSLIYAKAGDKKEAIAIAKRSLEGAEKAGNADYVKMNKESIAEWSKE